MSINKKNTANVNVSHLSHSEPDKHRERQEQALIPALTGKVLDYKIMPVMGAMTDKKASFASKMYLTLALLGRTSS